MIVPKPICLLWNGFEPLFDCGHHTHSHSHCPRVETYLFYQWMTCHSLIGNGRNEHVPEYLALIKKLLLFKYLALIKKLLLFK